MSKVRAIVLSCALTTSWLGAVGPLAITQAQAATDEEKAGARALAEQAIDAFNKGQFAQAVDLLHRAESLVHSPGHWLYMGRAYVKLGRLVLAQEAFLKAEREPLSDVSRMRSAPRPPKPARSSRPCVHVLPKSRSIWSVSTAVPPPSRSMVRRCRMRWLCAHASRPG